MTTPDRRGPGANATNVHSMTTPRLRIDVPESADAATLFELVGGPDRDAATEYLIWDGPESVEHMSDWVEKCQTNTFDDWGFHWTIRDTSGEFTGNTGQAMGSIGTRPLGTPGRADVGYWLGRAYWGRGIMGEALSAVLKLGFDTLDYAKIEASVFSRNTRGIRLVESVGMQREGLIRRTRRKRGVWIDEAVYGILPEDIDTRS